jgi:MFS transporter, Spinster family, sphingosine-1-phosphate transporter
VTPFAAAADENADRPAGISARYAGYALGLLTVVNLVNYLSRNAVFALFEPVKRDLGLADAHLGLLGTAYVLVFSVASLPAGILGDLGSRRAVIAGGILLWSVGTILSGLAQGFTTLFLARALVGLGGAAAATASAALVANYFQGRRRSMAMSILMVGLAVGGVLGILVAGQLEHAYGWRVAFIVIGLPGFLLTALVMRLKEPDLPPGRARSLRRMLRGSMRELQAAGRRILQTPTLVAVFVGGALISFGMNGLVGWAPTLLSRELNLSAREASLILGSYGLPAGIAGTLAGGAVADWLRKRMPSARIVTSVIGFFIGGPLLIWLLQIRDMSVFIPVFSAAFFFLTWYNGPLTAVIFDVSPLRMAATVSGAYLMFIHLAGDAIAFPLVGYLSDAFGLHRAVVLLPIAAMLGAIVCLAAVPKLVADTERART